MISSLYLSFYQNIAIYKRELWSLGGLFIHILRRIFMFSKILLIKTQSFAYISSGIASPKANL